MIGIGARPARVTDLALSFAPFAILLGGAIIASVTAPDVLYARTQWAFRVAMLLAAPALVVLVYSFGREPLGTLWRLWWTFGFLAVAVHVSFALFGMDSGKPASLPQTMDETGAILVMIVLALWALDVVLAWTVSRSEAFPVRLIRLLAAIGVVAATLYATFNRTGMIYSLGVALIVILAGALLARLVTSSRRPLPS